MLHPSIHRGLVPALIVLLTACGDDGTEPCVPASVLVTPSEATLEIGETVQLDGASRDATGSPCGSLTWSSASTAVATCSATGLVTGMSAGNATISARAGDVVGTATVTVTPPCAFTCGCDMSTCSLEISCEQGARSTQFTNEATRYEYDTSGRRIKIIKELSRVVTYLASQNAYTVSGTIEWDLVANKVTWNIQVTGGAFGDTPQVCSGSSTS